MVIRIFRSFSGVVVILIVLVVSMGAAWDIIMPSGLHPNSINIGTYGTGEAGENYRVYVNEPDGDNIGVSAQGTVAENGSWSTSVGPESGLPWPNGGHKLVLKSIPGYVVQDTHDIDFF